jgi:hypothetical protein
MLEVRAMPYVEAWRVVRTLEVHVTLEEDDVLLRVDLLQKLASPQLYRVRIWRIEFYRLQSTFPQVGGEPQHPPSDEAILKEFEGTACPYAEPTAFDGPDAAENAVMQYLHEWADSMGRNC